MNRLLDRLDKLKRIKFLEVRLELIREEIAELRHELDADTIHLMEVSIDDRTV